MTIEQQKRAEEIQCKIEKYNKIISNCSFPYIGFFSNRQLFFTHSGFLDSVIIDDKELKRMICDYARQKVKELEQEFSAL